MTETSTPERRERRIYTTRQIILHIFNLIKHNEIDKAAVFYSSCQEDIGYQILNVMPQAPAFRKLLAKMFYLAKDFEKAALIMEQQEDFARAGQLYELAGDCATAAEMYARSEQPARAAAMYEKIGRYDVAARLFSESQNFERAAVNFERAINNFLAGQMYVKMGKINKAIEVLQKVQPGDSDYLEATALIGELLAQNGYIDLAISRYLAVVANQGVSAKTLSINYNLARLFFRKRMYAKAKEVMTNVLNCDFNYRDAAQRLKEIEAAEAGGEGVVSEEEVEELEEIALDDESEDAIAADQEGMAPMEVPSSSNLVGVMEGFEFLKKTPIFAELSLAQMKAFYNICDTRRFGKGEILIEQDRPGQALFILKKGRVGIQRRTSDGGFETLAELGPGIHLGEMSLVDDAPTSARVMTLEPTEVFEITRERFEKLIFSDDKIALKINRVFIRTLAERLRKTTQEFASFKAQMENDNLPSPL